MPAPFVLPPAEPLVERAAFCLKLRAAGISDLAILRAMENVPREMFAPRRYGDLARENIALPLACGETMSAPAVIAAMLTALAIEPGQRVLEVGTGSGYAAALCLALGAEVTSLERRPILAASAALRLATLAPPSAVRVVHTDVAPVDEAGGFDGVLVNGAFDRAPPSSLTSLLRPGGRLVCGIRDVSDPAARLLAMTHEGGGRFTSRIGGPLRLGRIMVNAGEASATEA